MRGIVVSKHISLHNSFENLFNEVDNETDDNDDTTIDDDHGSNDDCTRIRKKHRFNQRQSRRFKHRHARNRIESMEAIHRQTNDNGDRQEVTRQTRKIRFSGDDTHSGTYVERSGDESMRDRS